MMLFRAVRRAAVALWVALMMTVMAGCTFLTENIIGSDFTFQCPQPPHAGLAIAVGSRANSPTPALPADVRKLIAVTMTGCGKITVVRVDGRPTIVGSAVFSTPAETEQNFQLDQQKFLADIVGMLEDAKSQEPEANVLEALSVAAGAAGQGGTVVVVDSGVQTTNPVDFRKNNLPEQQPKAIANALKRERLLPGLAGRSIVMIGLGYTAAPQAALDDRNRAFVRDLWREIILASGGADPTLVAEPNTSASLVTTPPVSVVDFPQGMIKLGCNTLSVLPDNGEVGFVPDQAEFRRPAAAGTVLQRFAQFLEKNNSATVRIEGFVAHYGAGDLSQRRAERVKSELIRLGARNVIEAKGMGWGPFPHPTADPDPRYDDLNRRVTIEVTCG